MREVVSAPDAAHRVAVLSFEGVGTFEVALAVQVFAAANDHAGTELYEVAVAGLTGPTVTRTGRATGYALLPDRTLTWAESAHTVIVPAAPRTFDPPPEVGAAMLRARANGARIVGLCLGTFLVAATGLLDGHQATTHWHWAEQLAAAHPKIRVHPERLFVADDGIFTSGGGTAALDLILHLIEHDHGSALATEIARFMVAPIRRDGDQAQRAGWDVPDPPRSLVDTLYWAENHLADARTVAMLAQHAGMSMRTFARQCRDVLGIPPMEWLQRARVRRARELLQRTTWTVQRIAEASGFGSESALRYHFTRLTELTPGEYRSQFGTARGRRPATEQVVA
ncbi:GlxA family transcriptional regulator [Nocardia brasiliensis]|uniref:GlxA family transcriptional regulator n=1 Tax=Nocardia brasiliensis TaxID=37326 RepID=UPI001894DC0E|nr:helix-turn-helix domain-containing protein [Nocardia brasiliensis]MBF6128804.1 helix-turn-helix domain-containing protein [Nocardia brasiliensis]